MSDSARQFVRQHLDQALETARPVLQARLEALSPEARLLAEERAEGVCACLRDLADGSGADAGIQEALTRLIFVQADPKVVAALKEFAEVVNLCLLEARMRMTMPPGGRMDA